jgi:hypothetical protein
MQLLADTCAIVAAFDCPKAEVEAETEKLKADTQRSVDETKAAAICAATDQGHL